MCLVAQSCPPGGLPNRGIDLGSPAEQAGSLLAEPSGEARGELEEIKLCLVVKRIERMNRSREIQEMKLT